MSLKTIKIAGFKSFAQPTVVPFDHLTAIVGPNGCGKSNIVDAILWVIGGAARHVRADISTDVIFKGSQYRKPLAKASVELIFDNKEAKMGGAYQGYLEIAIRREITLEGTSAYFLNNTRCRRRDIQDLLMGTGLGGRTYAVISQGMITRLIEAKPEELYHYFEEVADVSKSKLRINETQTKIRETKANLVRLNDVQYELEQQKQHLKKQVSTARRYQQLKTQLAQAQNVQQIVLYQSLCAQLAELEKQLAQSTVQLDKKNADKQQNALNLTELLIEKQDYAAATVTLKKTHYQMEATFNTHEEKNKNYQERKRELHKDLTNIAQELDAVKFQQTDSDCRIISLNQEIAKNEPAFTMLEQAAQQLQAQITELQQEQKQSLQTQKHAKDKHVLLEQSAAVAESRYRHLSEQYENKNNERTKLKEELHLLESENSKVELSNLEKQKKRLLKQCVDEKKQLECVLGSLDSKQKVLNQVTTEMNNCQHFLHQIQLDMASLQAKQEALLGKQNKKLAQWIHTHELHSRPRLGESIQVEKGWEKAVETILGDHLQALCVSSFKKITQLLDDLPEGNINFLATGFNLVGNIDTQGEFLINKINSKWPLNALLAGIHCAETLSDALKLRETLTAGESVVTRNGLWIGPVWVRARQVDAAHEGLFTGQAQLDAQLNDLKKYEKQLTQLHIKKDNLIIEINELEVVKDRTQRSLMELEIQCGQLSQLHELHERKTEQKNERIACIQSAQSNLEQAIQSLEVTMNDARKACQESKLCLQHFIDNFSQSDDHVEAQKRLSECENQYEQTNQLKSDKQRQLIRAQEQQTLLSDQVLDLKKRYTQLLERQAQKTEQLERITAPIEASKEALEALLTEKLSVEEKLQQAEQNLQEAEAKYQMKSQALNLINQDIERSKLRMMEQQMTQRELLTKQEIQLARLKVSCPDYEKRCEEKGLDSSIDKIEASKSQIQGQIERLGPVNLAAISEYEHIESRCEYLSQQQKDVEESLKKLEGVIHRISKEAKQQLQKTVIKVNQLYQDFFVKIFGGGKAELRLVSDDLSHPGIVISAQPPGKRNSSLQLLSGGEKALATLALTFALFQHNPAPFCFLDEVDAPLDDANVQRLVNLLKDMSQMVQLIFISHNKLSISAAKKLLGITMREPGVSRMVSVDIEAAMAMVE